jgi:hypothetical protein
MEEIYLRMPIKYFKKKLFVVILETEIMQNILIYFSKSVISKILFL